MKKILLFVFVLMFSQINAQNNVTLNINHKLGDVDFEMNEGSKNNIEHDFNVTRLEYYISKISIFDEAGNETAIDDLWVLANASDKTEIDLGSHDINSVSKVKFYIGVNEEHNHLDPSTYVSTHPLAPKAPSMHWGWTSGYRFVAIEGKGGSGLNQLYQLHGLGDVNYFSTEIELDVTAKDNQLEINLDADYTRALENISVNQGVIVHGDNYEAKECLENFRDFVFGPSSITSSAIDFSEIESFNTFPNPVIGGITTIELDVNQDTYDYDLTITSTNGKQLQYLNSISNGQQLDVSNYPSGLYFINLVKEGQLIMTRKIFVK